MTANLTEVTCENCRRHGLFKHAVSRQAGEAPSTQRRYFEEYDDLLVLSQEERARMDHYQTWLTAKAMSLVRLILDGTDAISVSVHWLERDLDEWRAVTKLINEGRINEAVLRVNLLNRRKRHPPEEDEESINNTANELVNAYRRNGYRIPEYGSGRLIPNGADWQWILVDHSPANLDEAIEALSQDHAARQMVGDADDLQALDPSVAFELAAIIADTIICKSSVSVLRSALIGAEIGLPKALVEVLGDRFGWNGKKVFEVGSWRADSPLDVVEKIREALANYKWMDPSVIRAATETALLAEERRRALHTEASALEKAGRDAGNLRKLASLYREQRGILIRNGNDHVHVRYRDWHRNGNSQGVPQALQFQP